MKSRYFSGFSLCEKFIQKKDNLLLTHQNTGDIIAFADAPKGNKKVAAHAKKTWYFG